MRGRVVLPEHREEGKQGGRERGRGEGGVRPMGGRESSLHTASDPIKCSEIDRKQCPRPFQCLRSAFSGPLSERKGD